MIVRRWISNSRDAPITTAAPEKLVRPELILYEGAKAPEVVEVRRTYEPLITRLLKTMSLQPTRHVIDLLREAGDDRVARYEAWPAALLEPRERPTLHFFRQKGKRRERSPVLYVANGASVKWTRPRGWAKLAAPLGPVLARAGIELGGNREITANVEAPVDPDVELFVLSPTEMSGDLSLEGYLDSYLGTVEASLRKFPEEGDQRELDLRSRFEKAYGRFVQGDARISTEIAEPEFSLGPEQSRSVRITLNPERPGATMMVIGARIRSEGGEDSVVYSDLLPLFWRSEGFQVERPVEPERARQVRRAGAAIRVTEGDTGS